MGSKTVYRKGKFQDKNFNEYCIQWLSSLSTEQIKCLSAAELKKIQPKIIGKYINVVASTDEKLLLLAKTGNEFYIQFAKKGGWTGMNDQKKLFQQYFKGGSKRQDIIQYLVDNKIFVLASSQIMIASYYMHQNCQSDVWRLNRDFIRLYNLWEITKTEVGSNRLSSEYDQVSAMNNLLVDFVFQVHKHQSYFANLGLGGPADILILMFLMKKNKVEDNRNTFTDFQDIYTACNDGTYYPNGFARRMKWLAQNGYTKRMATKRPRYAIADRGAMVVMEYTKKMAELVKFDL